ncbi:hypothetical protein [Oceanobacillus salinisoli]|uniref:hypothetical protein n=1 Tax=Oceanobacillus salinisoli TaxID=2678611 RepID=UPI0012E0E232|nr:hypothetical protein [Oceanobacillus salinisoli]
MKNPEENPWLKNLRIIEKHLEKNEKWFQRPEEKMKSFEKDAVKWNEEFTKKISKVEAIIKELEKKMEQ